MPIIKSQIDIHSERYRDNVDYMWSLIDDLKSKATEISLGGSEKARDRHVSRGKLLPRARIQNLIDDLE